MKNKLSKRIEANKNLNWSEHLIWVVLIINTQKYFSFFYNMMLYKVFFSWKYYNCANSLSTIEKAGLGPIRFIDK